MNNGPHRPSLAQPQDRTLTEAEIEAVSARVIEKVAKATGGTLRG